MFLANIRQSQKLPVVFIIIGALLFGFFCAGMLPFYEMPMPMQMTAQSEQPCCGTTLLEHIESWKSVFLAASRDLRDNMLALIVALLSLALAFERPPFRSLVIRHELLSCRFFTRQQYHQNFTIINRVKLAFARGIMHTKRWSFCHMLAL